MVQEILEDMNNIMILSIVTNFQFIKLVVGCHVFGALIPPLMRKYDHRKPFFVPIITAFNFTMTLSLNVLIGGSSLHFEIPSNNLNGLSENNSFGGTYLRGTIIITLQN